MISRYPPKIKIKIRNLVQTIRIFSQDIGLKFGIEKCIMLIMKNGKGKTMKGIKSGKNQKTWGSCKQRVPDDIGSVSMLKNWNERKSKKRIC